MCYLWVSSTGGTETTRDCRDLSTVFFLASLKCVMSHEVSLVVENKLSFSSKGFSDVLSFVLCKIGNLVACWWNVVQPTITACILMKKYCFVYIQNDMLPLSDSLPEDIEKADQLKDEGL